MSASWKGGSTRTWRKLRLYVLNRDGYSCQVNQCGAFATHVDHITPLSKGGDKYDDRNCRAACARCNLTRGNRSVSPDPIDGRQARAWSW